MFRHYHIENIKARILIPVYKNNKDRVAHFSQFILVEVKTILRKSQTQFWEELRKLRLRKNDSFL